MSRDGKGKFYRELFKRGKLDKATKELIKFFNEWKKEAQKER
jgi:hypothetical protein